MAPGLFPVDPGCSPTDLQPASEGSGNTHAKAGLEAGFPLPPCWRVRAPVAYPWRLWRGPSLRVDLGLRRPPWPLWVSGLRAPECRAGGFLLACLLRDLCCDQKKPGAPGRPRQPKPHPRSLVSNIN